MFGLLSGLVPVYGDCTVDNNTPKLVSINVGLHEDRLSCQTWPKDYVGGVEVADLDGDGRSDVWVIEDDRNWLMSRSATEGFQRYGYSAYKANRFLHGDFNGDGVEDIFVVAGYRKWSIHYGYGKGWVETDITDTTPIEELAAADIDGDGMDDIIMNDTGVWYYSPQASGEAIRIGTDDANTRISNVLFADFDGNGKKDAFKVVDGYWYKAKLHPVSWVKWTLLREDDDTNATIKDFAVGDFDGDGKDDIFTSRGGRWQFSASGTSDWIDLGASYIKTEDLKFGDMDFDGLTDIFYWGSTADEPNRKWESLKSGECDCVKGILKRYDAKPELVHQLHDMFKQSNNGFIAMQGIKDDPSFIDMLAYKLGEDWKQSVFNITGDGWNGEILKSSIAFLTNWESGGEIKSSVLDGDEAHGIMAGKYWKSGKSVYMINAEITSDLKLRSRQMESIIVFIRELDRSVPQYLTISTEDGKNYFNSILDPLKQIGFEVVDSYECTQYHWEDGKEICTHLSDFIMYRLPKKSCDLKLRTKIMGTTKATKENSLCYSKLADRMSTTHKAIYIDSNFF